MSGVFQNIDPPPHFTRRVCPNPAPKAGGTHSPGGEGEGVNVEDARHVNGLLQYNLSTVRAKSVKGKILEKEVNISPQLLPNEEDGPIKARKFRYLPPRQDQKHSAERLKILHHKRHNF